jgi:nicotinamidase-related amidase
MDDTGTPGHAVVGTSNNFWFWSCDRGWDLTHPANRDAKPFDFGLSLDCDISNVTVDPAKTALLVIDMQNFSMSTALGNDVTEPLQRAEDAIQKLAVPAARKAGIQVIWLNWGLTEDELNALPPSVLRVFGWSAHNATDAPNDTQTPDSDGFLHFGEHPRSGGLGSDLGEVTLKSGERVAAGRAAMRNTWNAAIHDELMPLFEEGQKEARPDVLVHKNRNSGLWNDDSALNHYLQQEGIRTLLFTGMNTDQCVMGNLFDAQARHFDTIFLKDGCATNSPDFAQQSAEYNARRPLGFLSSCSALARAAGTTESG